MGWDPYNNETSSPSEGGGTFYENLMMAGAGMAYDAYQQNQQRKANIKAENKARAWNRQMWEDINKYNNPISQMARFRDAGLNPNLIYGSSPGQAAGNAGAIHPGKAPEQKYSNVVSPAIGQFQNLQVQQAQSNNLRADAHLKTAQAIKTGKDAGISEVTLDYLEDTLEPRKQLVELETDIKTIKRDLDKGMKPYLISNQMHMSEKNRLAAAIMNKEHELQTQGYYKGNQIATLMKGVFNLDLSNPKDRLIAQTIAGAVLGSQVIGNLSTSFKNAMQAFAKKK